MNKKDTRIILENQQNDFLYKKDKDVIYIDMSLFLTDNYFNKPCIFFD